MDKTFKKKTRITGSHSRDGDFFKPGKRDRPNSRKVGDGNGIVVFPNAFTAASALYTTLYYNPGHESLRKSVADFMRDKPGTLRLIPPKGSTKRAAHQLLLAIMADYQSKNEDLSHLLADYISFLDSAAK